MGKSNYQRKIRRSRCGFSLEYNGFIAVNSEEAQIIKAYVLFSEDLPLHRDYLDEFEGDGYIEVQARYKLEKGENVIGFIYVLNQKI